MNEAGCEEVASGLIKAMEREKRAKTKKFDVEAMERVKAMMGQDREGCGISEINTTWDSSRTRYYNNITTTKIKKI